MLITICIMGIVVLVMNIKAVQKVPYMSIRIISSILFTVSIMRYITLALLARSPSLELISSLDYFYFISMISIPIPLILLIWYITPLYREKVKPLVLAFFCMPHIMLYAGLMTVKPFQVVKLDVLGYAFRQGGNWALYMAVYDVFFILAYIIIAIYGFKLYKHKQTRSQYLVLIMCQLLFLVDGLTYVGIGSPSIPVFTLTEVFGFLGIYYGFSRPTIDFRKKGKQKG